MLYDIFGNLPADESYMDVAPTPGDDSLYFDPAPAAAAPGARPGSESGSDDGLYTDPAPTAPAKDAGHHFPGFGGDVSADSDELYSGYVAAANEPGIGSDDDELYSGFAATAEGDEGQRFGFGVSEAAVVDLSAAPATDALYGEIAQFNRDAAGSPAIKSTGAHVSGNIYGTPL